MAVYQGKLVGHDLDREALYRRIDAKYPDEFVWIGPVEEEAIPTLAFRSPRIERNLAVLVERCEGYSFVELTQSTITIHT